MHYLFFSNQTWLEPTGFPNQLLPLLLRAYGKAFPPEPANRSLLASCSLNRFSKKSGIASSEPSSFSFIKNPWKLSSEAARERAPLTIAAVGAGGKTSLLMQLMKECIQLKLQVMVTTTTHMFLPEAHLLSAAFAGTEPWNQPSPILCPGKNPVFLGTPVTPTVRQGGWIKCSAPDPELFWTLYPNMDVVLVEADGSKRLPVKIPAAWEPVIPDCTDLILAVYGLSSLEKPLEECCHRWQLLEKTVSSPDPHSEARRLETLSSQPENHCQKALASRPEDHCQKALASRPKNLPQETLASQPEDHCKKALASWPEDHCKKALASWPEKHCQKPLPSLKITPKLLGTLMKQNYLDPLGKKYGYPSVIPVWNQADTQALTEAGKIAAACCGSSLQLITTFLKSGSEQPCTFNI